MSLTEAEQEQRRAFLRDAMCTTPFISTLGLVIEAWSPAGSRLRLPFAANLTNDGQAFHGGAIASLIDTTGAAAVWAGHDFDKGTRAATVSLTVNYVGAAIGTDLIGLGTCVKRGKDLAFAEIHVTDPAEKVIATASLVYRIVP